MGQSHPTKRCDVQAVWMKQGFWEYSIQIQNLPIKKVSSLVEAFQNNSYNYYIVHNLKHMKLLTVYMPEEPVFVNILQTLRIPFDLHRIVHSEEDVAPSAPPSSPRVDVKSEKENVMDPQEISLE